MTAASAAKPGGAEAEQFALEEAASLALLARDAGEELRAGFAEDHRAVVVGGAIEAGALERGELAEEGEDAGALVGRGVAEMSGGALDFGGAAAESILFLVDGAHARPVVILRARHLGEDRVLDADAAEGLDGDAVLALGADDGFVEVPVFARAPEEPVAGEDVAVGEAVAVDAGFARRARAQAMEDAGELGDAHGLLARGGPDEDGAVGTVEGGVGLGAGAGVAAQLAAVVLREVARGGRAVPGAEAEGADAVGAAGSGPGGILAADALLEQFDGARPGRRRRNAPRGGAAAGGNVHARNEIRPDGGRGPAPAPGGILPADRKLRDVVAQAGAGLFGAERQRDGDALAERPGRFRAGAVPSGEGGGKPRAEAGELVLQRGERREERGGVGALRRAEDGPRLDARRDALVVEPDARPGERAERFGRADEVERAVRPDAEPPGEEPVERRFLRPRRRRRVRGGVRRERGDREGEERSRGETKPGNTGKTGKVHCPQTPIVHCWRQFKVEMQISLRGLRVRFFPGGALRGGGGGQC